MSVHIGRRLKEGALLLLVAIAAYFMLSLITYSPDDHGWSYTGPREQVINGGGPVGAWFSDVFLYLFGFLAFLFPVMVGWSGWLIYKERNPDDSVNMHLVALRWFGFLVTLAAGSALAAMHFPSLALHPHGGSGGILGSFLQDFLVGVFSFAGGSLLSLALLLAGFTLFTGVSWLTVMDKVGEATLWLYRRSLMLKARHHDSRLAREARKKRSEAVKVEKEKSQKRKPPRIEPVIKEVKASARVEKEKQASLFEPMPESGELPPLALLDPAQSSGKGYSKEALEAMSRLVEIKLKDFGVAVEVDSVHPGPVVTLFELKLAPGTKVSKITNLSKDLARALSTTSVRVVEVIPGKS
ncbi:MAG: DNA translocase FtsK 4TM domain-containing protein, partial [Candidatus Sedimenticola sp. 6PFRAG5]